MGRRSSGSVSMQVEAEIEVGEFIANVGANDVVEAAVEEDRDAAYEAIDIDDFNEWARSNGYAPQIDAAMLIDDRESPVTAMAEVANEALRRFGANVIADFANSDKLDSDVRSELEAYLWPSPEEISHHDENWPHYLARIVSEFVHNHGTDAVLAALREQNALQSGFRAAMEATTREARLEAVSARLADGATAKTGQWLGYDHLPEAISVLHEDARDRGIDFTDALLCKGDGRVSHIREEIVSALRPEIERDVKKSLLKRLAEFVFGEVL